MSNEASTADKKITGEKTVKKKAGRNVVVSPVKVNSSGKPGPAKELTAPIGLVWNEDTDKAPRKAARTSAGTRPVMPERPRITGTGWPDRPPAPKVNRPGPIQYKTTTSGKKETSGQKPEPVRPVQTERPRKTAKKEEPVRKSEPAREPFSSEDKLDALIDSVTADKKNDEEKNKPQPDKALTEQKPDSAGKTEADSDRQDKTSAGGKRQGGQAKQPAGNPLKQGSVLYSPVPPSENHKPISPMQKRPVNTQVWERQVQQIPGYGEPGYGPKFVRTVVTTTTTTYEPVSEEVIRQITSQTSPVTLTENVIDQPQVMTSQQPVRRRTMPGQPQPGRPGPRPGTGQQVGRPPAGQRQQARPVQPQPVRPVQPQTVIPAQPQTMGPVQQVPGQPQQSIIGAMEAQGPAKTQHTGMTQQFAEIEKALGLAGDQPKTVPETGANTGNGPNTPENKPVPAGNQPPNTESDQKKSMEYMMLFVEGIIFLIVLAICISIFTKIKKSSRNIDKPDDTAYEETQPEPEDNSDEGTEDFQVEDAGSEDILEGETDLADQGSTETTTPAPSGSVDVDNDKFTLKCTNVTVKLDTDGNPAALIYFSFKNKTSEQKAIADVFPISVTQNGEPCDTFAALEEYPEEYYNKDMQISDGSELACAYAVSLKDAVSPIILTVHDNYDTFADVGSTEIALQ